MKKKEPIETVSVVVAEQSTSPNGAITTRAMHTQFHGCLSEAIKMMTYWGVP